MISTLLGLSDTSFQEIIKIRLENKEIVHVKPVVEGRRSGLKIICVKNNVNIGYLYRRPQIKASLYRGPQ